MINADIVGKAIGMARGLAQVFLNAAVWRVAWSLPMKTMLIVAAIIFILLVAI